MGLIIKSSIKSFRSTQRLISTKSRLLMLHFMLDVPENEGNSRKLKKEQEIVQHFSEKYVDIMYQNKI